MSGVADRSNARAIHELWFHRADVYGAYGVGGPYKVASSISIGTIAEHLKGERVIGAYPVRQEDGTVIWVAWDGDAHGNADKGLAEARMLALCGELLSMGATPIVEDSGGGFHAWLHLEEPVDARDAFVWAKALAERHKVAEWWPAYEDPTKIGKFLRLPGRHHTLDHHSAFLDFQTGEWVPWPDGLELFVDPRRAPASIVPETREASKSRQPPAPRGAAADDLELARRCLRFIQCYDKGTHDNGWLDVIMALHHASGGSDDGLSLASEWSRQGAEAFDEDVLRQKWRSFGRGDGRPITVGTLVYLARKAGAPDRELFAGLRHNRNAVTPTAHEEEVERPEQNSAVVHEGPLDVTVELVAVRPKGRHGHCDAEFRVRRDGADVGTLAMSTSPSALLKAPREFCRMVGDHLGKTLTESEKFPLRCFLRPIIAPDRIRAKASQPVEESNAARSADIVTSFLRQHTRPAFRGTKGRIFFETYERSMTVTEFVGIVPRGLLDKLTLAADVSPSAPDSQRAAVVQRLARVAFATFLSDVPVEADANELGPDSAAAKAMRNALLRLWLAPISFGTRTTTLAGQASQSGRRAGWGRVCESVPAAFVQPQNRVVALRHELARGQVHRHEIESAVSLATFGRILKRYGLLHEDCDPLGKQIRLGSTKVNVLVLSAALSAEILEGSGEPAREDGDR